MREQLTEDSVPKTKYEFKGFDFFCISTEYVKMWTFVCCIFLS